MKCDTCKIVYGEDNSSLSVMALDKAISLIKDPAHAYLEWGDEQRYTNGKSFWNSLDGLWVLQENGEVLKS
jgi:hypothetical protein